MIETCIVQSVFHLEIRLNNRKWTLRYHILNMYHKMCQLVDNPLQRVDTHLCESGTAGFLNSDRHQSHEFRMYYNLL